MDFRKIFEESYKSVFKNKILALPYFLSLITLFLIILFIAFFSGFSGIISEYGDILEEYNRYVSEEQKRGNFLHEDFETYSEAKFDMSKFESKFMDFLPMLILLFSVWYLISTYLSATALNSIIHKEKNPSSKATVRWSPILKALKYLLAVIVYYITLFLLAVVFIGGPTLLVVMTNLKFAPPLAILLILAGIFAFIVALIYVAVKVLFFELGIFFENKSIITTFSNSISTTKNRFKKAFVIGLILYGISTLINSIGSNPVHSLLADLILSNIIISQIIFGMLLIILLVIAAFTQYFLTTFKVKSYVALQKEKGDYKSTLKME